MPRPLSLTFSDLSIDDATSIEEADDQNLGDRFAADRRYGVVDASALPSLIHSPSSSVASTASVSAPRPLPSRHNKSYSAGSILSVDLVTPHEHTGARSTPHTEGEASSSATLVPCLSGDARGLPYDDRAARRESGEAQSSAKQLFSHEAVKAPPVHAIDFARRV
ncbi:hypothetical protein B0A55_01918 [Friedmanniomyces simplex]|uniref:Uncharacterized protein n=1 Tax=Friedmanniomyces simplex TaxID=329884 RepID=A0A4U0XVP5_9PEZI|nr:hypothetical protein B0A55_01918 [Friedmanniomyces simplex]